MTDIQELEGGAELSDTPQEGAFADSLKRNNRKIRDDRAEAIQEECEMDFKRYKEDVAMQVRRKTRERDNMLDMSPENSMSLMVAKDFDSIEFVKREMAIGVELRELNIKLEIAEQRYNFLFGAV